MNYIYPVSALFLFFRGGSSGYQAAKKNENQSSHPHGRCHYAAQMSHL